VAPVCLLLMKTACPAEGYREDAPRNATLT